MAIIGLETNKIYNHARLNEMMYVMKILHEGLETISVVTDEDPRSIAIETLKSMEDVCSKSELATTLLIPETLNEMD
tara:strand:- start:356 stop:586 length:231 start_codon:yes stop_codon:yes gene_type:complete